MHRKRSIVYQATLYQDISAVEGPHTHPHMAMGCFDGRWLQESKRRPEHSVIDFAPVCPHVNYT